MISIMPKLDEKPALTGLTQEQAQLRLVRLASKGDRGAREFLDTMYPDPKKKKST